MIFGFSSMGKAEAGFPAILDLASAHQLSFVELRALGGTTDLAAYFRTSPGAMESRDEGGAVRLVSTSLRLVEAAEGDIRQFQELADLAGKLGAAYLRVFGGGTERPEDLPMAVHTVNTCRSYLRERRLKPRLLLETHDAFSSSKPCLALNRLLDEPLEILWDSHHTWRLAGEAPAETWDLLGPLIRHVHYKDSVARSADPEDHAYVFPGEGEFPSTELLDLLRREQFAEGISLEWERLWHPELPDLEPALEAFCQVTAPYRK